MFNSHMNRKAALKSIERVSPLMNRTCFICETSSRYGRARPQAQMVPPSRPPPQSRPVYEDVKLAEGSRAASAREVAHTDWLFHPCLMIHYRCRTCSRTFCLTILIFWKSLGWEMHCTTVFYDLITECLLKWKQSIAWKRICWNKSTYRDKYSKRKEVVRVCALLSADALNKKWKEVPVIDFIVAVHQQNVGCDLKDVSPFHLSSLSVLWIERRCCFRQKKYWSHQHQTGATVWNFTSFFSTMVS